MADGSHLTHSGRQSAPDEVWARAREAYLAGMSAPDVCRLHGVGLSALRDRAAREGWRRVDQPWRPPNALDPWDEGLALEDRTGGDLDKIEMRELSFVAHRRMIRAVLRGDAGEALRWRRVSHAMDEEEAEVERLLAQDEAILFERAGRAEPADTRAARIDRPDASDASDGVFSVTANCPHPDSIPPGFTQ